MRKAIPGIKPEELDRHGQAVRTARTGRRRIFHRHEMGFYSKRSLASEIFSLQCDESEPGTFKDRLLIEHDPHQLIEGMILSSYAIGSQFAVIYCRGEFFEGLPNCTKLSMRQTKGYLGNRYFGTDFSLEIVVHPGAGAYIAGEETALLNSLEGYRATPRLKPPFPAVVRPL